MIPQRGVVWTWDMCPAKGSYPAPVSSAFVTQAHRHAPDLPAGDVCGDAQDSAQARSRTSLSAANTSPSADQVQARARLLVLAYALRAGHECRLPSLIADLLHQRTCPFGDAALQFKDTVLAAETCEELFTPMSPHIRLALSGALSASSAGSPPDSGLTRPCQHAVHAV